MKRRVVVTGLGVITSLSQQVDALWDLVLAGESGIHLLESVDRSQFKVQFGGDVYDWDPSRYLSEKEAKRVDRFSQFAIAAGSDAVEHSGVDFTTIYPFRAGVILGSGIGGLNEFESQHTRLVTKGPQRVSPLTIPKLMLNAGGSNLSIRFGLRGVNYSIATACASANNAMGDAFHMIQKGDVDIILTGGSEAAVTPMGVSGFQNMRALSTRNDEPTRASRPFDMDRDGFVLSEGAGILVFEDLEHARNRGAEIHAEVLGFGLSCDASHITQPDEQGVGAARAMTNALKPPRIPVISNVDARQHDDPEEIRDLLIKQVVSPVRWEDSMRQLLSDGFDQYYEIGPGRTMRGLLRRIDKKISCENITC